MKNIIIKIKRAIALVAIFLALFSILPIDYTNADVLGNGNVSNESEAQISIMAQQSNVNNSIKETKQIISAINDVILTGNSSPLAYTQQEENRKVSRVIRVQSTAYTSRPEETDDTPFITASNTHVRWGVVAANFLPFGTELRIPELYGDTVFRVEDRMHSRFDHRIDLWFADLDEARQHGIRNVKVEILEG